MLILRNQRTGKMARHDSTGEHDGRVTEDYCEARQFEELGDAADYSQNFGPDFEVEDYTGHDD